jgi:hypothetical protein
LGQGGCAGIPPIVSTCATLGNNFTSRTSKREYQSYTLASHRHALTKNHLLKQERQLKYASKITASKLINCITLFSDIGRCRLHGTSIWMQHDNDGGTVRHQAVEISNGVGVDKIDCI